MRANNHSDRVGVSNGFPCRLIIDPPLPGPWNMALDEALLAHAGDEGVATLRFYQWSAPTLSLGYFQRYEDRAAHAPSRQCAIVRRQSGGGAILHDRELTYSLVLPSVHPLARRADTVYAAVHKAFIQSLRDRVATAGLSERLTIRRVDHEVEEKANQFLCFERRSCGDVVAEQTPVEAASGQRPGSPSPASTWKVLGSAQRRFTGAVLQHGSLLLGRSSAAPELPGLGDLTGTDLPIVDLIPEIAGRLEDSVGLRLFRVSSLPENLRSRAEGIMSAKYGSPAWTNRR